MKVSPARAAAYEILLRIDRERAFSSALLPAFQKKLSAQDRSLCHELVLGTLRRRLYLDHIVRSLAGPKKLDREIAVILQLGLYQLYFLERIPAYSAINESVNLTQKARKTSAKGFVNAMLRKAAKNRPEVDTFDEIERISINSSHPRWLIERWIRQFGTAIASATAEKNNEAAPSTFRLTARNRTVDPADFDECRHSAITEGAFVVEQMTSRLLELAERGEIYFQDEASQLVGQAVSAVGGQKVLDCCAAPGSKTSQIAVADRSAQIFAGDFYDHRTEFLRRNCQRQGVNSVRVIQYDAEALPFIENTFDTVLVDAPCSGTGTIRHNPEIRYHLAEADIAELSSKQLRILENASKVVKPGGVLLYSTCSLEVDENEGVCNRFLRSATDFRLQSPKGVSEQFYTEDGFARTFPHRDSIDGFFIASFRKL